jgi:two-component system, NtrC family, response regulator HydG
VALRRNSDPITAALNFARKFGTLAPLRICATMDEPNSPKLLAIDQQPQSLELIKDTLSGFGLEILIASSAEEGLETLKRTRPRIVLLDLMTPGVGGADLLETILAIDPGTEIILITNEYSAEAAVEAIQHGACDYLSKPLNAETLRRRISQLLAWAEERRRTYRLDHELINACQFEGIVGRSPVMLDVFAKIRRVAPHFRTVLISGATGTGKELVARALHNLSPVPANPFVVRNCSAIVDSLMESELFGHVKGAFTGASQDKLGVFEYANHGTVFLDEIGELPLTAQSKLLRVLQNHEIQRVGAPAPRTVDVRVIAATNRNLRSMVKEGTFREDLYYRLAMVEIKLPGLAERREDLPLLERYFLEKFSAEYNKPVSGVTRRAQTRLAMYSWPGNVRELENVIGNACMMVDGIVIDVRDLPESIRGQSSELPAEDETMISLDELQKRHMIRVLERVGGNKSQAAEILGVSRATIYQLLGQVRPRNSA